MGSQGGGVRGHEHRGVCGVMKGFMQRLQQDWKTSALEVALRSRFVAWKPVRRMGYIDLVGRHPEAKNLEVPAVKAGLAEEEEEEDRTAEDVREAQAALGEFLSASTRARPDVAFAVGQASRMVARNPKQGRQDPGLFEGNGRSGYHLQEKDEA